MKVIMAKDSAFIPTLKDGDFSLCPSRSYKLKKLPCPGSAVHLSIFLPIFEMHIAMPLYPGKYSYPGTSKPLSRRDMNKNSNIILKVAAILMVLIGLLAMLVAWELLLVSGIHNSTVLVLEMGGVVICMAGYFLWRRVKWLEKKMHRGKFRQ